MGFAASSEWAWSLFGLLFKEGVSETLSFKIEPMLWEQVDLNLEQIKGQAEFQSKHNWRACLTLEKCLITLGIS